MKKITLCIAFFCATLNIFAQSSAGDKAIYESRYIVDMPTAGVLAKGTFSIYTMMFQEGGLMAELYTAPFEDFNMGLSFGGSNVIGTGKATFQNLPGIHIKYRIIDETRGFPAITLGVITQGRGLFYTDNTRFQTMSPGVFAAVSKNFKWALGSLALHGGLNYSFEPKPENRNINFYAGMEQSIGNVISLNLEFNSNLDDKNREITVNQGMLNAALRWSVAKGLTFELQARDLLKNSKRTEEINRIIGIEFISPF